MPTRAPVTRRASAGARPSAHSPRRTNRSAAESRRITSITSPTAVSATQSVSTSGVLETTTPRPGRLGHVGRVVADAEVHDRTEPGHPVEVLGADTPDAAGDRHGGPRGRGGVELVERYGVVPLAQRRVQLAAERPDHHHSCLVHGATVGRAPRHRPLPMRHRVEVAWGC